MKSIFDIKVFICVLLTILNITLSLAQNYNNEWINNGQTYYPIKIDKEQLVRLNYEVLATTEMPLLGNGFQLWKNGQQVPIYVSTEANFGNEDYIEFYASPNDGTFDTQLYQNPEDQLHYYKSLFSDIATYYLTWNDEMNNPFYQQQTNEAATTSIDPLNYYIHTERKVLPNQFYPGTPIRLAGTNMYYANFGVNEGWVGGSIFSGSTASYSINTPALYEGMGAPSPMFKVKIVGRSNDFTAVPDHHVQVTVNGTTYINETYEGYGSVTSTATLFNSSITNPTTEIGVSSLGDLANTDNNSVAYMELSYPRSFDMEGAASRFIQVDNEETLLFIENFDITSPTVLYDLTNHLHIEGIVDGSMLKFKLPTPTNSSANRELYITNTNSEGTNPPLYIVDNLDAYNFVDFSQIINQGNYIILTHENLTTGPINWVQGYHNYRASQAGGNHEVITINIDDLYHQFAYGIAKHPLAIQNFINYAIDNFTINPVHLLLLGKALEYQIYQSPSASDQNLVPTYGDSGSDAQLVARDNVSYIPQLSVGRVPAKNSTEVAYYLNKLIAHEATINTNSCNKNDRLPLKHVASLVQANNDSEVTYFENYIIDGENVLTAPNWGGFVTHKSTSVGYSGGEVSDDFVTEMNKGLAIVSYFGHSTNANAFNYDIGMPEAYEQSTHYPLVMGVSCFVGSIHNSPQIQCVSENYILAEGAGAIAFIAHTALGIASTSAQFQNTFYANLVNTHYGESIGQNMRHTINDLYVEESSTYYESIKITMQQISFAGDPAVKLYTPQQTDYLIDMEDINVQIDGITEINDFPFVLPESANSLSVNFVLYNLGKAIDEELLVTVQQVQANGLVINESTLTVSAPYYKESLTINLPVSATVNGTHAINIIVDSNEVSNEICEENNHLSLPMQVTTGATAPFTVLQANILLQGAEMSLDGLGNVIMANTLRENGLLPKEQPFNAIPWNYSGNESFIDINDVPTEAIDWLLIEILAAETNELIEQKAALLLSNGTIVSTEEITEELTFYNMQEGLSYYLRIRSRNHLDIISSNPILVENNLMQYDFTTAAEKAMGTQQVLVMSNKYAMYTGDIDGNGVINVFDFNKYLNQNAQVNQYLEADLNLDANITITDFNFYKNNASVIGVDLIRFF